MSLNREDMLRELELLPVWRSQRPAVVVDTAVPTAVEATDSQPPVDEQQVTPLRLLVSQEAQWVIALDPLHSEEAEALLRNMLQAVEVRISQDVPDANAAQINEYTPKVIVMMGESVAQQLLNEKQTLAEMRGRAHQFDEKQAVVTFAPEQLLINPADKVNAWEDICLIKFTIASLP